MKFLYILATILMFTGCGNNGNSVQKVPSSPQTQDSSKTPPSVPHID